MVYFQAALGAYVRHLEAGQACPDFPKCLGRWVPSSSEPEGRGALLPPAAGYLMAC